YRTHETDFGALAQELHGATGSNKDTSDSSREDDADDWSDYAEPPRD
ncbi:MAG TPA: DUF3073 family protein, partial [Nocardioides sp.]